ncbi:transmembrane 9 superfamily member 4 precursor [Camelus ferus]|nr:transmembrane 9 superfamily member 4 precursor [Camelus ferus]
MFTSFPHSDCRLSSSKQDWLPWSLLLLSLTCDTGAFYVPGVAPINFHQNDPVEIKAVKLTSSRTQLPYEYYSLPFCQPSKITYKAENLGEVLRGDRIVNTPFQVLMNSEKKCEVLCSQSNKPVTLTVEQSRLVAERITEDYYVHLIADNLPVATRLELYSNREGDDKKKEKDVQFEHGYRLGFTDVNKIYLHNHLSFILYYHREDLEEDREHTYRVVRFEVIPQSIRLEDLKADEKSSCTLPEGTNSSPQEIDPTKENQLYFTYSVHWEESDIKWASRWDTYLTMSDVQIHWFSIINSVVVVFFLSGILSMIIIRTLRKDIANYNKEDDIVRGLGWGGMDLEREGSWEDTMEESGWKLVHGDVFRPPQYPMILSSLLGSGIQLFCMILIVIYLSSTINLPYVHTTSEAACQRFVAMLGMLSPSSRGALMTTACFLFMFMGVFGGFSAGRLYRTLKGHRWKKGAFCTSVSSPEEPEQNLGLQWVPHMFSTNNPQPGLRGLWSLMVRCLQVPFPTMVALLCMWFGISLPLVYLGYYFGFRKQPYDNPVRTNQIPRQIPEQRWYMNRFVGILMAGILPFGAMFIELFFIFSAIWENQFYYLFGFLFLVFIILVVSCSQISIVMVYFQLCAELDIVEFIPSLLYFGYTALMVLSFWLLTGTIGFYAAYMFVRKIYAAVKID